VNSAVKKVGRKRKAGKRKVENKKEDAKRSKSRSPLPKIRKLRNNTLTGTPITNMPTAKTSNIPEISDDVIVVADNGNAEETPIACEINPQQGGGGDVVMNDVVSNVLDPGIVCFLRVSDIHL